MGLFDFEPSILAAATFRIAEITLASDAAQIDIPNIPATYSHLMVIGMLRSTRAGQTTDNVLVVINGDATNANYDQRQIQSASIGENLGSGGTANTRALGTCTGATSPAGTFGTLQLSIPAYSSTTKRKVLQAETRAWRDRNTGGAVMTDVMIGWASTAAINQLTILPSVGPNFLAGSSVSVYGVKGAAF